jgi:tRNA (cytidine/uridine-2'-O-)-methyltransferase
MLHIVLNEPEIAENTGNIGRTCVALGAKLWLVRPLGFRLDQRRLRRAGLDYWEHLDWEAADNWDDLLRRMPTAGRLWFFSKTAQRLYTEADFQADDKLVFGSESRGLPPALLASDAERLLRIPMCEQARSLNLAVAVGVVAYEATRQCNLRTSQPPHTACPLDAGAQPGR